MNEPELNELNVDDDFRKRSIRRLYLFGKVRFSADITPLSDPKMEVILKTFISTTATVLALAMTPALAAANSNGYDAHERCKKNEDSRQVLGGLAGAVVGGVVGSQVSGNGARTEGSAIGAVIGGLAGAGIADKTVDCDPVYETTETIYAPASTTSYGHTQYGTTHTSGTGYQTYEDRVTVSNHPVYSDPYYGAGAVSQGSTYSTGHVSYPPSGSNSQYVHRTYETVPGARDFSSPVYSQVQAPTQSRVIYSQPTTHRAVYTQPTTSRTIYAQPAPVTYRRHSPVSRRHYHGRYSCDMAH